MGSDFARLIALPGTLLLIAAAVLGLLALAQGLACRRHWRDLRRIRASWALLLFVTFLVLAAGLGGAGWTLRGYHLLAEETPVLAFTAHRIEPGEWQLRLELPDGAERSVQLLGDGWRAEAVVLKWKLPGVLAGLPPVYRLDRVTGRDSDPRVEASHRPSIVSFPDAGDQDLFRLALAHQEWLPMVDTIYGSGAWMPLVDGARYEVKLMGSGALVARRIGGD